eukprot:155028_1
MGNSATNEGCGRKLKIEDYPNDIKEDEWIPIGFEQTGKENQEVFISKGNDRRIRVLPEHYNNSNAIQNIVQLRMKYSYMPAGRYKIGSGIIIHSSFNRAFVLTAAHNIVELDLNNFKQLHFAESIWVQMN